MKKLKSVIFIMVLTTITLSMCAFAKSPLLLLQEGVYAEETEGDLDKAIGLYKQVIDNASEVERIAAKAAYKLGMCYLKKDDKESAAKYFQSVVERYPSQKVYINKAKEQLEKIKPAEEVQLPWDTLIYLAELHLSFAQQAEAKGMYVNSHIHGIDENYNRYSGGIISFKNKTGAVINEEVSIGNFGQGPNIKLINELGQTQKYRYVDSHRSVGRFSLMWTPDRDIQPEESRLLGYFNLKPNKLKKTQQGYEFKMNNYFGAPVLETFFVIMPAGMELTDQSESYTKKIPFQDSIIYYWQKEVPLNTNHEVTITVNYDGPKQPLCAQEELPLLAQLPPNVLGYIGALYGLVATEAIAKNLNVNDHIYYVSPEFKLFQGGYGYYQQPANSSTPDRIRISGTTRKDQIFYDVSGNKMKVEIEDRPGRPGYYDIYWKPEIEIPAGQPFYYSWCKNKSNQLNSIANTNAYPVTMQNKFGSPVLEVFFLVLPEGFNVSQQSEDFTKKETFTDFDIYQWKKEVPANTDHMVTLVVSSGDEQEQEQEVLANPFDETNQPYTIWFRATNASIKSREDLLGLFNSIVDFKVNTYKFRTKTQGQSRIASICTDGKDGRDKIVELLNNSNKIKFIKATTPYIISFKATNPTDESLLKVFNRCHPKDVSTHHFSITTQQGQIIGNICTDTSTEKDKIVSAIGKSGTMVLVGIIEPIEKQLSQKRESKKPVVSLAAKKQAEDLRAQGWQLWGQQKFAEAEQAFKRAVKRDPTNDNAYQGLGWAQLNQGKKLNAKDTFEKCVEVNPENSAALNGLGWIADGQGNKDEAIKWWEKAVEASNGNATASLSGLSKAYMEKGDYEKSVKYYKMWLKVEPGSKDAKAGLREAEQGVRKIKAALKSALDWLELIDQGSYDQSWDNAAALFKIAVNKKQWETAAKTARGPLGKFIARVPLTKTYTTQVPGGPDGEYLVITFKASFENKDSAVETVTPMLDDDGRWKVSGYYIK